MKSENSGATRELPGAYELAQYVEQLGRRGVCRLRGDLNLGFYLRELSPYVRQPTTIFAHGKNYHKFRNSAG